MNKFWNWVRNEDTGAAELIFNGPISEDTWFGDEITPAMFRNELSKISGDLTVWLNSPGGDVFAASQIYTMLRNHKGKVTVKIARMMDEETWLNAKKAQSLGLVDGILFASGQPNPEEDPDDSDEDTPEEDEPKKDNLTAMSYSRAATMQSLMQKVSAEHKGTPVDQLMSRLNLLKY